MKVLIGMPVDRYIESETFRSLYNCKVPESWSVELSVCKGYGTAMSRNWLVNYALKHNFDAIFFLDNDVVIPWYTFTKFNFWHNKGYKNLGGHYPSKFSFPYANPKTKDPFYTCVVIDGNGVEGDIQCSFQSVSIEYMKEHSPTGLFQAKGSGLGCNFIDMSIFTTMKSPFFSFVEYPNGSSLSEDLHFFHHCNNVGLPLMVDPLIACGHIGPIIKY